MVKHSHLLPQGPGTAYAVDARPVISFLCNFNFLRNDVGKTQAHEYDDDCTAAPPVRLAVKHVAFLLTGSTTTFPNALLIPTLLDAMQAYASVVSEPLPGIEAP
jgi:hypothetical protein